MDIWVIQLAGSRGLKFCPFLDFKYKGWWGCGKKLAGCYPSEVVVSFSLWYIGSLKLKEYYLNCSEINLMREKKSCKKLQKVSFWKKSMKWYETWVIPTKMNFHSMSKNVWAQSTAVKIVINLSLLHLQDLKYRMCWK